MKCPDCERLVLPEIYCDDVYTDVFGDVILNVRKVFWCDECDQLVSEIAGKYPVDFDENDVDWDE